MTQRERFPLDTARLDMAFRIRAYHHNSIWEEQKHFTWLISIFLAAELIALNGEGLSRASRAVIVIAGSVVGIILASVGFRVQRREGESFRRANALFVEEFNAIFPLATLEPPAPDANKTIRSLAASFLRGRAGVRDYFQVLFLSFIIVFVGLAVFAVTAI